MYAYRTLAVIPTVVFTLAFSNAIALDHPHVFFDSDDIDDLQDKCTDAQADDFTKKLWYIDGTGEDYSIKKRADDYVEHVTANSYARIIATALEDMAFAYVITEDTDYSDKVLTLMAGIDEKLESAVANPWDDDYTHAINYAQVTRGCAIAFDYCYDQFPTGDEDYTRADAIALIEKMIGKLMTGEPEVGPFDPGPFNMVPVIGGAVGLAAIALEDEAGFTQEEFEEAKDFADPRIKVYFQNGFDEEGAPYEGSHYGAFGLMNAVAYAEALLQNNKEPDFYEDVPRIGNIAKYYATNIYFHGSMTNNVGYGCLAINDDWGYIRRMNIFPSLAKRFTSDDYAPWIIREGMQPQIEEYGTADTTGLNYSGKESPESTAVIWFDDNVIPETVEPPDDDLQTYYFPRRGQYIYRSGWWNTGATYPKREQILIAFECGLPDFVSALHGHSDKGHIWAQAYGERLLVDRGYADPGGTLANHHTQMFYEPEPSGPGVVYLGELDRTDGAGWYSSLPGEVDDYFLFGPVDYFRADLAKCYRDVAYADRVFAVVKGNYADPDGDDPPPYILCFDQLKPSTIRKLRGIYQYDRVDSGYGYDRDTGSPWVTIPGVDFDNVVHLFVSTPEEFDDADEGIDNSADNKRRLLLTSDGSQDTFYTFMLPYPEDWSAGLKPTISNPGNDVHDMKIEWPDDGVIDYVKVRADYVSPPNTGPKFRWVRTDNSGDVLAFAAAEGNNYSFPQPLGSLTLFDAEDQYLSVSYVEDEVRIKGEGISYVKVYAPEFSAAGKIFYNEDEVYDYRVDGDYIIFESSPRYTAQSQFNPSAWEFESGTLNWTWDQLTEVEISGGELVGTTTGSHPKLYSAPKLYNVVASPNQEIYVRMLLPDCNAEKAWVWWSDADQNPTWSTTKRVEFPVEADGLYHEYKVDMNEDPDWSGDVKWLRFDPMADGAPSYEEINVDFFTFNTNDVKISWEFSNDDDAEGWESAEDISVSEGRLYVLSEDPAVELDYVPYWNYCCGPDDIFEVRMKVDSGYGNTLDSKVYWETTTSGTGNPSTREVSLEVTANDDEFHVYRYGVGANANWHGVVKELEFYPIDEDDTGETEVYVDYVRIFTPQDISVSMPGVTTDLCYEFNGSTTEGWVDIEYNTETFSEVVKEQNDTEKIKMTSEMIWWLGATSPEVDVFAEDTTYLEIRAKRGNLQRLSGRTSDFCFSTVQWYYSDGFNPWKRGDASAAAAWFTNLNTDYYTERFDLGKNPIWRETPSYFIIRPFGEGPRDGDTGYVDYVMFGDWGTVHGWEFGTNYGDSEESWAEVGNSCEVSSSDGILTVDPSTSSPQIEFDPAVNTVGLGTSTSSEYVVKIKMKVTPPSFPGTSVSPRLYWTTRSDQVWDEAKSVVVQDFARDGEWYTVYFDVGDTYKFHGTLRTLRFAPCGSSANLDDVIEIDLIRIIDKGYADIPE